MQHHQLFVILLLCIGTVLSTTYEQCDAKNMGTLDNVVIVGCETTDVCVTKRGTNLTMHMSFTTSSEVLVAQNNVTAYIANAQIPFVTFEKDACKPQFELDCPLAANTMHNYTATIAILNLFPTLSTTVTWDLIDGKNNTIVCFKKKVKITD